MWNSKSLVLASAERGRIHSSWRSSDSSIPRVTTCSRFSEILIKSRPGSTPLKVARSTGQRCWHAIGRSWTGRVARLERAV